MASTSKRPASSGSELSDEDVPLTKRSKQTNAQRRAVNNNDSSDDDAPLSKTVPVKPKSTSKTPSKSKPPSASKPQSNGSAKPSSNGNGFSNGKPKAKPEKAEEEMDVDEDVPLKKKDVKPTTPAASTSSSRKRPAPAQSAPEDSDDEPLSQTPLTSKKNGKTSRSKSPVKKKGKKTPPPAVQQEGANSDLTGESGDDDDDDDDSSDDDDKPLGGKKGKKGKGKKDSGRPSGGTTLNSGKGEVKWKTLYHTGPRFPDEYEPLPKDIMLIYDGKPIPLEPLAEEAAMHYAIKKETSHARSDVFNKNFFGDFQKILKEHPPKDGTNIKKFEKCDFGSMYDYWRATKDAEIDRKKGLAPSARKMEVEARKKSEAEMKVCIVDGQEQKVGNVVAEPPSLFLGRGAHPKTGHIKARIRPEDITINHTLGDPDHPPPEPPAGHSWKAVIENNTVTWLAYWQENINNQYKYMYLDATSNFKTNSDRDKYEKARNLDKCIRKLRATIDENLSSKNRPERQIATVVWLIDNYSLRAGNEKGDDEAATYGACSLLVEHATLVEPEDPEDPKWVVKLSFLGKDSMKFEERLEMPQRVWNNFKMFMRSSGKNETTGDPILKEGGDAIFHCIDTGMVNNFLQDPKNGGMKGLSAKVFRTYNASTTFQGLLNRTEEWLAERPKREERILSVSNLKLAYNEANRQVAILCNHQKTVNPVQHEKNLQRTEDKMFSIRYDRFKELQKILTAGTAIEHRKNYPAASHDFAKQWDLILQPIDLKKNDIKEHEEAMFKTKKDRIQGTFDKSEKEKIFQADRREKEYKESKLPEAQKLAKKEEDETKFLESRKGPKTQEEVDAIFKDLDEQLEVLKKERDANKSFAENISVPNAARNILRKVEMLKKQEAELVNKENTKEVSLGTSKLNYIDPRITLAWIKKFDNKLVAQNEAEGIKVKPRAKKVKKEVVEEEVKEEEDVKPPTSKGGKKEKGKAVKKEDDDDDDDDSEDEDSKPASKRKGKAKGKAVKKEEEEEDVKPASKGKGKGKVKKEEEEVKLDAKEEAIGKAILKADPEEVEARALAKAKQRGNKNSSGDSEKMELDLRIMTLNAFFPAGMQKKFKWAATDDDGKDLSPNWVFVEDAESKMRTMSSAITDNSLANEEKEKKEGAFRPKFKSEAELPGDESN